MRKISFIALCIYFISCNAQEKTITLNNDQTEVLKVFLKQQEQYSYVDCHFFNKNLIKKFSRDYLYNREFFRISDSVCSSSADKTKLRFYCPLADSFKVFDKLLTEEDLKFLVKKYNYKKQKFIMNIDSLINNSSLRKHSKDYYAKIKYEKYDGIPELNEFPSIRINNLYFNKKNNVPIVVYSLVYNRVNSVISSFYILEKKNNIWWKPIGNLKI